MPNFSEVVEEVISLETAQMEEIKDIISKALVEKKESLFFEKPPGWIERCFRGSAF